MPLTSLPPRLARPAASHSFLNLRHHSLMRGCVLVLGSFLASFRLSGFPATRATLLLTIPALVAILGTVDTIRCMQRRWTLYHSGVVLLIYMDMMAICLILFFLIAPYLF
jgi:type II secretory pathway component PulF